MIKAIVKDEAELKSLETQRGYQVHFEEGGEAERLKAEAEAEND